MSKQTNIPRSRCDREWLRKLSAGLLLLLFVFSMTPRKDLHDFLANHHDTPVKHGVPGTTGLHTAGFHCNCESLVVESPFIGGLPPVYGETIATGACCPPSVVVKRLFSVTLLSTGLRGPPFA